MKFLYEKCPELSGEKYELDFVFSRYNNEDYVLVCVKLINKVKTTFATYPIAVLHNGISEVIGEANLIEMYRDTIDAIFNAEYNELAEMMLGIIEVKKIISNDEETYDDEILNLNKKNFKISMATCLFIGEIINKIKKGELDEGEDILEIVDELDNVVANYIANKIKEAVGSSELIIEVDEESSIKVKL